MLAWWMGELRIGNRSRISVRPKSVSLCPLKVRFQATLWLSAYMYLRRVPAVLTLDDEDAVFCRGRFSSNIIIVSLFLVHVRVCVLFIQ